MTPSNLEDTTQQSPSGKTLKNIVIDASASITFGTVVGGANEYLIAGMTLDQVFHSRGMMMIPNLLVGRPYGVYRDWMFRKTKTRKESHWLRKGLLDIFTLTTFQCPIYAGVLALAGADKEQITAAVTTVTLGAPLIGVAYGRYLDWFRNVCGIQSHY